jgi:hypothetical protein
MSVLEQFDWPLESSVAVVFYDSVYLPQKLVRTIDDQQPILQDLLHKFIAEHQQQLAAFLSELQQTAADVRLFHTFSDIERTELYAACTDFLFAILSACCSYADSVRTLQARVEDFVAVTHSINEKEALFGFNVSKFEVLMLCSDLLRGLPFVVFIDDRNEHHVTV